MSNATNSEARLESILDQVQELKDEYDRRAKATCENSIFPGLYMERYEVKTHSAIIGELLNPQGFHSQETLFLKLFLDQLLKKLEEEEKAQEELKQLREKLKQIQDKNEFDKFKVEVETSIKDEKGKALGRIDILIESDGIKSGDVCIVIENKIYAEDQEGQLGRYYEYALGTGKKRGIIYLTLRGNEPEEFTLYEDKPSESDQSDKIRLPKDTVVCLSYEEFIDEWLNACIKEVARIPQIRETLHQYRMTVRKLTRQHPLEIEDIMNELGEELDDLYLQDFFRLESQHELRYELQHEFWKKLKERLEDQNPKFQLYGYNMEDEEISDEKLETYIGRSLLGLTFSIPNGHLDDEHEVAFRVDYETTPNYYHFNYGFVFCTKGTLQRVKIERSQHKEALGRYRGLKHKADYDDPKHDGWISWDYFQYEPASSITEPASFITESKDTLLRKLISEINLALSKARE